MVSLYPWLSAVLERVMVMSEAVARVSPSCHLAITASAQSLLLPFAFLYIKCGTKMMSSKALRSPSGSRNSRTTHMVPVHKMWPSGQQYMLRIAGKNCKFH